MDRGLGKDMAAAAVLSDARAAKALLARRPIPGLVRAVAMRADELRFEEPRKALGIAAAALETLGSLPEETRRKSSLAGLVWAVYGSACRVAERYDECELALAIAARKTPKSRAQARAGIARRLASLRAIQERGDEARRLIPVYLDLARQIGGRQLGRDLVDASAILIVIDDYERAAEYLVEALTLLPANGDRFHLSAVFNLARCRVELASSMKELKAAERLIRQAARFVKPGSFNELRLRWLTGNLLHKMRRLGQALDVLETARREIDRRGSGYDRALILLDVAELHLDRRDAESANALARSSFGILSALRKETEAVKAMRLIYDAGASLSLDRATVRSVRQRLLALRP